MFPLEGVGSLVDLLEGIQDDIIADHVVRFGAILGHMRFGFTYVAPDRERLQLILEHTHISVLVEDLLITRVRF